MAIFSGVDINIKLKKIADKLISFGEKSEVKNYENFSIVLNPNSKVVPYVKEISDLQKEKFMAGESYFSRVDLVEEVAKIIYPSKDYARIINKLKWILKDEDI